MEKQKRTSKKVDISPNILMIKLNINGVIIPIVRDNKIIRPNFMLSISNPTLKLKNAGSETMKTLIIRHL